MFSIANTKLFMLDMDGTFYLGDTLLPGAKEFLQHCRNKKIAYTFLTNNSSKSPKDYIEKLALLGVNITRREIFTSADATLEYLSEKNFAKNILLIGTDSLEQQFKDNGYKIDDKDGDCVVLGFDTSITYSKLTALCDAVRSGKPYIATHPDFNCPTDGGFIPDIGAVIAFVKASTQREPDAVIGKPNGYISKAAAKSFGVELEDVCMVGDRLYTDIALGKCGCGTALVLCGETSAEQAQKSDIVPDIIADNLAQLKTLF
ncbi:MAG: HAD-IIA family hydrolase [Oscillospiraceae bacterium]